jgi:hypothetical protein
MARAHTPVQRAPNPESMVFTVLNRISTSSQGEKYFM